METASHSESEGLHQSSRLRLKYGLVEFEMYIEWFGFRDKFLLAKALIPRNPQVAFNADRGTGSMQFLEVEAEGAQYLSKQECIWNGYIFRD